MRLNYGADGSHHWASAKKKSGWGVQCAHSSLSPEGTGDLCAPDASRARSARSTRVLRNSSEEGRGCLAKTDFTLTLDLEGIEGLVEGLREGAEEKFRVLEAERDAWKRAYLALWNFQKMRKLTTDPEQMIKAVRANSAHVDARQNLERVLGPEAWLEALGEVD